MRLTTLAALLLIPLGLAAELRRGDSAAEIRPALGEPRGQLKVGAKEVYYYERGEVEVRDGLVTRVALRSEAEQAKLEQRRFEAAARSREEAEVLRTKLVVEGTALKQRKLADAAFLATPVKYQVAFWENFSRRYAEVPVSEQLAETRSRLAVELQTKAEENQRIAELEARVASAEEAAQEARIRSQRTQEDYSFYPVFGRSYREGRRDRYHGDDNRSSPNPPTSAPYGMGKINDGPTGFYLYGRDYQQAQDTARGFNLYGPKYGRD